MHASSQQASAGDVERTPAHETETSRENGREGFGARAARGLRRLGAALAAIPIAIGELVASAVGAIVGIVSLPIAILLGVLVVAGVVWVLTLVLDAAGLV